MQPHHRTRGFTGGNAVREQDARTRSARGFKAGSGRSLKLAAFGTQIGPLDGFDRQAGRASLLKKEYGIA